MKKTIQKIIQRALRLDDNIINVVIHRDFEIDLDEVKKKINFYFVEELFQINYKVTKKLFPITGRTLYFGFKTSYWVKKLYSGYLYDINKYTNPEEAWQYHFLLYKMSNDIDFNKYKNILIHLKSNFLSQGLKKAYFFGTGPSLEKAININWSDGVRIVCNTIVKDKMLWHHINPQIVVAGDSIYHFGIGEFSLVFRKDLKSRLKESPNTFFCYPSIFHPFCLKEFSDYVNQLVPIPILNLKSVSHDLTVNYFLPNLPNVLPLLGLPIACTFSNYVGLWGFDGKAPNDKDFWKNSDAHFYQSLVPELKLLHPGFYNFSISDKDPMKYINLTQGDQLDKILTSAEKMGFSFQMLHKSHTETLAKRFLYNIHK